MPWNAVTISREERNYLWRLARLRGQRGGDTWRDKERHKRSLGQHLFLLLFFFCLCLWVWDLWYALQGLLETRDKRKRPTKNREMTNVTPSLSPFPPASLPYANADATVWLAPRRHSPLSPSVTLLFLDSLLFSSHPLGQSPLAL